MPASQPDLAELEHSAGEAAEQRRSRCFTRQLRLLKPAEYKRVFSRACRVSSKHLTVLALLNHLSHPRLGMAISRKNVKHAVKRNLIKRQLRESFRLHQAIIGGFDVVVLAKPGSGSVSRNELRQEIDSCWKTMAKKCVPS